MNTYPVVSGAYLRLAPTLDTDPYQRDRLAEGPVAVDNDKPS